MTLASVSEVERQLSNSIGAMLARPDFLLPLAAAEGQFREHYYGLNAAALLEDLFYDAFGNFLRQTSPTTQLRRPPTGQKGWDYEFDGLKVSHKVSHSVDVIAAIWDATLRGIETWSFQEPVVYVLGQNAPSRGVVLADGLETIKVAALSTLTSPYVLDGHELFVVRWPTCAQPQLLERISSGEPSSVTDLLSFRHLWSHMTSVLEGPGSAWELEVLVSARSRKRQRLDPPKLVDADLSTDISAKHRAGVYILPVGLLQDLPVTSNNRGILIPKETVASLLTQSAEIGLFTPLPTWFKPYAQARPPDMYSAQRAEYDALFSARGIE